MRNEKGMTLIEMIVSILILSIASLMLFSGFSRVIRLMSDGASVKNATNQIVSGIEGDPTAPEYAGIIDIKNAKVNISIAGETKPITVYGSMLEGSIAYGDGAADTIDMAKYTTKVYSLTENEKKAMKMMEEYRSYMGMGFSPDLINYIKGDLKNNDPELYVKLEKWTHKGGTGNIYSNNDIFRNLFFFYNYYRDYEYDEVVNDSQKGWPTLNLEKMKKRDGSELLTTTQKQNTYYIQTYHYYLNNIEDFIIYASRSRYPDESSGRWDATFIFNSEDSHWYYRTGANYGLAGSLTSTSDDKKGSLENYKNLMNDIRTENGWTRVFEDE